MPMLFYKEDTKQELILNLEREFKEIERIHKISPGDFPDVRKMQELLKVHDFSSFESRSDRLFAIIENVMTQELPKLMRSLASQKTEISTNPFAESNWAITEGMKEGYDELFRSLKPTNGCVSGAVAREPLMGCGVEVGDLRKIWELSDFEKDGTLDADEFALAMFLCQRCKAGEGVPLELPPRYIPPSKRHRFKNLNF